LSRQSFSGGGSFFARAGRERFSTGAEKVRPEGLGAAIQVHEIEHER
jgi:hypothetical protein